MSYENRGRSRRDLTADLLERLLDRLSPDRGDAAERYNRTRSRLVHFFGWKLCDSAEDLADEVIDRVSRRLAEGQEIPNLNGYFLGVARLVALEAYDRRSREGRAIEELSRRPIAPATSAEAEASLACLDECLGHVSAERRGQLLAYYTGDGSTRIEDRRRMAATLNISALALRNRMLRVRQQLETCVGDCLAHQPSRDGSSLSDTDSRRPRRTLRGDERQ